MLMSQELMNNRERVEPIYYGHIWLGSQQKKFESGVKSRENLELIRAEKSVPFVGMYLAGVGFGWDTSETDRQTVQNSECGLFFLVPADIAFS